MHFTDAPVFPRLVWTARTAGKGISIGTDVMSRISFQLFKNDIFYVQNLHAVIYLIFCIFSPYLFIVRFEFLLHAVIFFACCFTLVCRNKSPTGLMLQVCEYSTKKIISMSMSMLCRVAAQNVSPHIIHSADYIFLLVF